MKKLLFQVYIAFKTRSRSFKLSFHAKCYVQILPSHGGTIKIVNNSYYRSSILFIFYSLFKRYIVSYIKKQNVDYEAIQKIFVHLKLSRMQICTISASVISHECLCLVHYEMICLFMQILKVSLYISKYNIKTNCEISLV